METKIFEVRDRGTNMPAIAVLMSPTNAREHLILRHAGYSCRPGDDMILFGHLEGGKFCYDPYETSGNSTRFTAHRFIEMNWAKLNSGDVICTEFIRGERTTPKETELG